MSKNLFAACCLLFFLCLQQANAKTIIPQAPESEPRYSDFEVSVNGESAPVWQCRVSAIPFNRMWPGYQRSLDQTELAGFATWETDAPETEIIVKTTRELQGASIIVRPLSLNIQPKVDVENKEISFTVPGTTPVVLEINGFHNCLHLLPFPVYERPSDKTAPKLRYFGPGVHTVGIIKVESGDEIFLDSGAVVYGGIHGANVENVKISGPGILDGSLFKRGDLGGIFNFSHCKNITIDGIVQRDTDVWATTLHNCDDFAIRNTKLIGFWRYNADGVDLCNSERILVENSFLRTFDDSLVVKGIDAGKDGPQKPSKDLTFRNNVIWCDWGRAMELGAETRAPEFSNIKFQNIDVIRTTHIAMDIQHGDRARIRDVVFEDVRVEYDDKIPTPIYQNTDEQVYNADADPNYCPELAVIVIQSTFYSGDKENGSVDNVFFKNIKVYGSRDPSISFTGYDANHMVKNVSFENLEIGGETKTSAMQVQLNANQFVEEVEFKSTK